MRSPREILGNSWDSRDFLENPRENRISPDFPGSGLGGGSGSPPGIRDSAGFPVLVSNERSAARRSRQRARKGAKKPSLGKFTVKLFPLALLRGAAIDFPRFSKQVFPGEAGKTGKLEKSWGKVGGAEKLSGGFEFSWEFLGTSGNF